MTRRRHSRLLAVAAPEDAECRVALGHAEAAAAPVIPKPDELTQWDWAVFLLHTVAEIEHVLMDAGGTRSLRSPVKRWPTC
jgi:hypothetical protein